MSPPPPPSPTPLMLSKSISGGFVGGESFVVFAANDVVSIPVLAVVSVASIVKKKENLNTFIRQGLKVKKYLLFIK